jgi:hypothetical protein
MLSAMPENGDCELLLRTPQTGRIAGGVLRLHPGRSLQNNLADRAGSPKLPPQSKIP